MSGETEASVSGWTVDTLRAYLNEKVADTRDFTRQQILDLRDMTRQQAEDHRRMLDERYATQTKALDAAFKAAEQAVAVALSNAEKATTKAEAAADKRFDAVNEFRQVLTDQTSTFLRRTEYDTAHVALVERFNGLSDRMSALELRLTSRLDRGEGADEGTARRITETREQKTLANSSLSIIMQALIGLVAVAALIASIAPHIH
jgi:purine nucleoside permease